MSAHLLVYHPAMTTRLYSVVMGLAKAIYCITSPIVNYLATFFSKVDYIGLSYALMPPIFALLTIAFSSAESDYFVQQATDLSRTMNRPFYQTLFTDIAKSASALKNHIVTLISFFLSLLIIFHKWPDPWRYIITDISVVVFLLIFRTWTWRIFSLPLNGISGTSPRKKQRHADDSPFHDYTYAEYFTRLHIIFNIALCIIILTGYLIFPSNSKPHQ
jgi:hypothetical protein